MVFLCIIVVIYRSSRKIIIGIFCTFIEKKSVHHLNCRNLPRAGTSRLFHLFRQFHHCRLCRSCPGFIVYPVITNSLTIINCLSPQSSIRLIAARGAFDSDSNSFMGLSTLRFLSGYHVDKAFISCRSLSMEHGITDSYPTVLSQTNLFLQNSTRFYLKKYIML